ncbi:hypothetical protein ABZ957_15635 [Streptomyces sp. NPDC046316]
MSRRRFGGTFRANPALDLRDVAEREKQVDDWLHSSAWTPA